MFSTKRNLRRRQLSSFLLWSVCADVKQLVNHKKSVRKKMMRCILVALAIAWVQCSDSANASVVYSFVNGGLFEGDIAGSTATLPADSISGVVGTIETLAVVGGAINENANALGVGNAVFESGESWTFAWDVFSTIEFLDFNALTGSEEFLFSNSAWVGRNFLSSNSFVTFNSGTGTFRITDNTGTDQYNFASFISGDALSVGPGQGYTISAGTGSAASLERMTFSVTAVPEPSTLGVLAVGGVIAGVYQRRRRVGKEVASC